MARRAVDVRQEIMELRVTYDGPAVADGRMDARDLAPAMLATAKLFEHSASLLYGATAGIKIEVQADFRRGSFSYSLLAASMEVGHTHYFPTSASVISSELVRLQ